MKRNVFVFGLLAGITVALLMIASIVRCYNGSNFEASMLLGYASMLIAFSFVFVGVKNLRDKKEGGVISFGRAFKAGLLMTLIASTIYVLVWLVEYYLFIPDFMDRYTDHMVKKVQASGANQVKISETIKEMAQYKEMYKNPLMVILMTYAEILPVGLVASLLSALILRRKQPKTPQMAL